MAEALRGDIVRELRKQIGMNKKQFADAIGVERTRIIQIESGIPTTVKAAVFARMLEVLKTKPYILLGQTPPEIKDPIILVPIIGYVPCGCLLPCDDCREGYLEIPHSLIGDSNPDRLFAVRAQGHSLIGDNITEGDYMVVDKDAPFEGGKIYIVQLGDYVVARHCYREKDMLKLISGDGSYLDVKVKDLQILGQVILSGKWREH